MASISIKQRVSHPAPSHPAPSHPAPSHPACARRVRQHLTHQMLSWMHAGRFAESMVQCSLFTGRHPLVWRWGCGGWVAGCRVFTKPSADPKFNVDAVVHPACPPTHTRTHARTHAHTHTRARAHTHTQHTHTQHTHTQHTCTHAKPNRRPLGYNETIDQAKQIAANYSSTHVDLLLIHWPRNYGRSKSP